MLWYLCAERLACLLLPEGRECSSDVVSVDESSVSGSLMRTMALSRC